jgi:ubiquinone/menaquinone biosynthesis C-methylase UbiE
MLVENSVRERYSEGARERQDALCCPVDYDRELLKLLPQEIIDKDYGCGDPSRYVQPGDTVLDLGSGGGKICYMAAQLVGPKGLVIGVDMNDDMLSLARKYQAEMAKKLGGDRVRFLKGYIQDLSLDVAAMERYLAEHPVTNAASLAALKSWQAGQRKSQPLIADASVDLVISNCVLNLVPDDEKSQLVKEIFRVLKPGGRVAISDITADEPVPQHLKDDPSLWSGCVSGAFEEREFVRAFEKAGFTAVCLDKWEEKPWRVIEGIEFRAVTLVAFKGYGRECLDRGHAVIYRGPYAEVRDEEGHIFPRGERIAVCERTFRTLTEGPCRNHFIAIEPQVLADPVAWCAPPGTRRPASETKGGRQISTCGTAKCC